MKLMKLILVLALAFCVSTIAYAETQSVKISGDITMRGLSRVNYAQTDSDVPAALLDTDGVVANHLSNIASDHNSNVLMSQVEVQIDADLTDNVSGTIRLYNQRDWGESNAYRIIDTADNNSVARTVETRDTNIAAKDNINIDLAYVTMKEFLYAPLTLTIGRQNIWIGKGFIVGANRRNPGMTISAPEYTVSDSFDALRATLDYDPWTIDFIYSKTGEGIAWGEDDIDLYGANVGYIFDQYNAEAEAYYFLKDDTSTQPDAAKYHNQIHTFGMRGSADPIEWATLYAEGALQFGKYVYGTAQEADVDRLAWAFDVGAECRYFTDQYAWQPKMGIEWIYYSGDDTTRRDAQSTTQYTGWDPMYRGKYDSKIREWQGTYYTNNQYLDGDEDQSYTNQHQLILSGSIAPMDSVVVDGRYINFWQASATTAPGNADAYKSHLGQELDIEVTWDYTEDVSYNLLGAWFFPGEHYNSGAKDVVTDIVVSMNLSF